MRKSIAALGQFVIGREESSVLRDRLVRGAVGLLGLRIAFSSLAFAGTVVLARLLGQAGYGVYSYAWAWTVLITVPAVLGMDQLLVRDVAAYHAKSEWGRLHGLLRKATLAVFLTSTGLAVLAGVAAWLILGGRVSAGLLPTFWVALTLVPLVALTRVRQAAIQGLHRVALGTMPEQLIQPSLLLAFLSVAYWYSNRMTAPVAMALTSASAVVGFIVGAVLLYRVLPQPAKEATPVREELAFARSVLPILLITGVSVIFGQADTLILGALKGAAVVGIYTVAHKGAEFVSFPLVVQNAAFASTIASLYALGEHERLQRLVTRLTRWTLLASAPVALGLMVLGRWFLYLYGPQFSDARLTLAILSAAQLFDVAIGSVGILLIMTGHERDAAISIAIGAAANIALTFVLVPRWGSEGAAVAYAMGMILWNVLAAIALHRSVGIDSTAFWGSWLHPGKNNG
jgi:O-antigen/teichoic acid export membrane protein